MYHPASPLERVNISSRVQNVTEIVKALIQLEKHRDHNVLYSLAQSLEQKMFESSTSKTDYAKRVKQKMKKLSDKVLLSGAAACQGGGGHQENAPADTNPYFYGTSSVNNNQSISSSAQGSTATTVAATLDDIPTESGPMRTYSTSVESVYSNPPQTPPLRDEHHRILSRIQSIDTDHGLRKEVEYLSGAHERKLKELIVYGKRLLDTYTAQLPAGPREPEETAKLYKVLNGTQRTVDYMNRCRGGHVPSAKSVENLRSTLKYLLPAHRNICSRFKELKLGQEKQSKQKSQANTGPGSQQADLSMNTDPSINRESQFLAQTGSSHPSSENAAALPQYQHPFNADDVLLSEANVFAPEPVRRANYNETSQISTGLSSLRVDTDVFDLKPMGFVGCAGDDSQGLHVSYDTKWQPSRVPLVSPELPPDPLIQPLDFCPISRCASHTMAETCFSDDSLISSRKAGKTPRELTSLTRFTSDESVKKKVCTAVKSELQAVETEHTIHAPYDQYADPLNFCLSLHPMEINDGLQEPVDDPFGKEITESNENILGLSGSGLERTKAISVDIMNMNTPPSEGSEMDALDKYEFLNSPAFAINQRSANTTQSQPVKQEEEVTNVGETGNVSILTKVHLLIETLVEDMSIYKYGVELLSKEGTESCMLRVCYHDLYHVYLLLAHLKMDTAGAAAVSPVDMWMVPLTESELEGNLLVKFAPGEEKFLESKREVYRMVSRYALEVLQGLVVEKIRNKKDTLGAYKSFFKWMGSYKKLFSDPCVISNKQVSLDLYAAIPLPPTGRTANGEAIFPANGLH